MRLPIIAYGAAFLIISAIIHYLVVPGVENCSSMTGIVTAYTSKDYSLGCQILSNIQTGAFTGEIVGIAVIALGIILKGKTR